MAHSDGEENDVTDLLIAWRHGDGTALDALMPIVYRELKRNAAGFVRHERDNHTLQPTALVSELYLRLVDVKRMSWQDRAHFFAMCATFMRRILVEHAREQGSAKRGRGLPEIPLEEARQAVSQEPADVVALEEARRELAERDPQMARIVELRFFGGLNRDEIAEVMNISSATVTRKWRQARAWLGRYLKQDGDFAAGDGDG